MTLHSRETQNFSPSDASTSGYESPQPLGKPLSDMSDSYVVIAGSKPLSIIIKKCILPDLVRGCESNGLSSNVYSGCEKMQTPSKDESCSQHCLEITCVSNDRIENTGQKSTELHLESISKTIDDCNTVVDSTAICEIDCGLASTTEIPSSGSLCSEVCSKEDVNEIIMSESANSNQFTCVLGMKSQDLSPSSVSSENYRMDTSTEVPNSGDLSSEVGNENSGMDMEKRADLKCGQFNIILDTACHNSPRHSPTCSEDIDLASSREMPNSGDGYFTVINEGENSKISIVEGVCASNDQLGFLMEEETQKSSTVSSFIEDYGVASSGDISNLEGVYIEVYNENSKESAMVKHVIGNCDQLHIGAEEFHESSSRSLTADDCSFRCAPETPNSRELPAEVNNEDNNSEASDSECGNENCDQFIILEMECQNSSATSLIEVSDIGRAAEMPNSRGTSGINTQEENSEVNMDESGNVSGDQFQIILGTDSKDSSLRNLHTEKCEVGNTTEMAILGDVSTKVEENDEVAVDEYEKLRSDQLNTILDMECQTSSPKALTEVCGVESEAILPNSRETSSGMNNKEENSELAMDESENISSDREDSSPVSLLAENCGSAAAMPILGNVSTKLEDNNDVAMGNLNRDQSNVIRDMECQDLSLKDSLTEDSGVATVAEKSYSADVCSEVYINEGVILDLSVNKNESANNDKIETVFINRYETASPSISPIENIRQGNDTNSHLACISESDLYTESSEKHSDTTTDPQKFTVVSSPKKEEMWLSSDVDTNSEGACVLESEVFMHTDGKSSDIERHSQEVVKNVFSLENEASKPGEAILFDENAVSSLSPSVTFYGTFNEPSCSQMYDQEIMCETDTLQDSCHAFPESPASPVLGSTSKTQKVSRTRKYDSASNVNADSHFSARCNTFQGSLQLNAALCSIGACTDLFGNSSATSKNTEVCNSEQQDKNTTSETSALNSWEMKTHQSSEPSGNCVNNEKSSESSSLNVATCNNQNSVPYEQDAGSRPDLGLPNKTDVLEPNQNTVSVILNNDDKENVTQIEEMDVLPLVVIDQKEVSAHFFENNPTVSKEDKSIITRNDPKENNEASFTLGIPTVQPFFNSDCGSLCDSYNSSTNKDISHKEVTEKHVVNCLFHEGTLSKTDVVQPHIPENSLQLDNCTINDPKNNQLYNVTQNLVLQNTPEGVDHKSLYPENDLGPQKLPSEPHCIKDEEETAVDFAEISQHQHPSKGESYKHTNGMFEDLCIETNKKDYFDESLDSPILDTSKAAGRSRFGPVTDSKLLVSTALNNCEIKIEETKLSQTPLSQITEEKINNVSAVNLSNNASQLENSPLLFSSDDENFECNWESIETTLKENKSPVKSITSVCLNTEIIESLHRKLQKIQELLLGIPPPPSITMPTHSVEDMLRLIKQNEHLMLNTARRNIETTSESTFPQRENRALKDVLNTKWPQMKECEYFGIQYNHGAVSEELDRQYQRLQQRFVGRETASTCSAWFTTWNTCKNTTRRQRSLGQSPGSRLSHLARRRQSFSSSNLQPANIPGKLPAAMQKTGIERRLIMVDLKKEEKKHKFNSHNSHRNGSYRGENDNRIKGSRRALFQSPVDDKKVSSHLKPRSLFQSMKTNSLRSDSWARPGMNAENRNLSAGESFNINGKRVLPDLQNHPRKISRRLIFDAPKCGENSFPQLPTSSQLNERKYNSSYLNRNDTRSETSTQSVSSSQTSSKSRLSGTYKKKLLWAVAEALRREGIGMNHNLFHSSASALTRLLLQKMPSSSFVSSGEDSRRISSEQLLESALQHVHTVVKKNEAGCS